MAVTPGLTGPGGTLQQKTTYLHAVFMAVASPTVTLQQMHTSQGLGESRPVLSLAGTLYHLCRKLKTIKKNYSFVRIYGCCMPQLSSRMEVSLEVRMYFVGVSSLFFRHVDQPSTMWVSGMELRTSGLM